MARLPQPGGDTGQWGEILNDYLLQVHASDGTLKDSIITSSKLEPGVQASLAKADSALQSAPVSQVAGKTGVVTLTKSDVGLANVDNTNDADKPVSTAQQSAIDAKVSGPISATDNSIVRFDGTTGKVTQGSGVYINDSGNVGIGTTDPTHSLTIASSGTGLVLYNSADQTANYERVRHYFDTTSYVIATGNSGTGATKNIFLNAAGTSVMLGIDNNYAFLIRRNGTAASIANITSTGIQAVAGVQYILAIDPVVNQTGTAGYTMLRVNPSHTSVGTGTKLLADFSLGGVNKTTIDINGKITTAGGIAPRVVTLTAVSNTYTPNNDTTDVAIIASPTANFTIANPTGTPLDGQRLTIRVRSGTTGYTPTWGTIYLSSGMIVLPTATLPVSRTVTLTFMYDSVASKYVLMAYDSVGY